MKKFVDAYGGQNSQNREEEIPREVFRSGLQTNEYDVGPIDVHIKAIDEAMIKWFDKDEPITVMFDNKNTHQVRAIWSSADRFSMMNSDKHIGLRDEHGTLILPIISVKRSGLVVVPERTAANDKRGDTNLRVYIREYIDPVTKSKHYIGSTLGSNAPNQSPVIEVIEVVAPKIVRLTYNVTCWSKKTRHSNEMLENVVVRLGQHHAVFLNEHTFFGAWITDVGVESNEEQLGIDERVFSTSCNVNVEAPIILEDSIRRYKSYEHINLNVDIGETVVNGEEIQDMNIFWDSDPYKLRRTDNFNQRYYLRR